MAYLIPNINAHQGKGEVMNNQLSTKDISNLVDTFVSSKLLEARYKDDMFHIICRFLEGKDIDIVKNFNGKVCIEFDFEIMKMGNVDDVKELVTQEIFDALHSIRYKDNLLSEGFRISDERYNFEDIEQDYKSEWER
jgi:hypothetical protein